MNRQTQTPRPKTPRRRVRVRRSRRPWIPPLGGPRALLATMILCGCAIPLLPRSKQLPTTVDGAATVASSASAATLASTAASTFNPPTGEAIAGGDGEDEGEAEEIISDHRPSQLQSSSPPLVIGIDGGTESVRAAVFDATTGEIVGRPCAVAYPTYHPNPGWAEQEPEDWWTNLGEAVRGALDSATSAVQDMEADGGDTGGEGDDVRGRVAALCVDTTCCSVVALSKKDLTPLRPSLLWMDARSSSQASDILRTCRGDPALRVNCDGDGPISAEWLLPKALWIRENEPKVWKRIGVLCEYQDYVNLKLTGEVVASSCNAAARWHWDGEGAVGEEEDAAVDVPFPGRPMGLYEKLGVTELATRMLPRRCLPMGAIVGTLTARAAEHLSLPEGVPVAQGGPDAFVGMVGLGCINPGQLCLITGSSHLHCVVSARASTAPGTWGAYRGAPLPGTCFAEGGQSSTGSLLRWAKRLFGNDDPEAITYAELDNEASRVPIGSDGLVALETFQGSRTPETDPLARGALVGLTLSHTRAHIWRALMEGVCMGTRACVEALSSAGHKCDEIVIAGGSTRSPLWLQMHADVTGLPVIRCENADAPLLGCAILASVGAGIHPSVRDAVEGMVREVERVEPDPEAHAAYTELYEKVYKGLAPSIRPVVHAIAKLRGGGDGGVLGIPHGWSATPFVERENRSVGGWISPPRHDAAIRGGDTGSLCDVQEEKDTFETEKNAPQRSVVISPSLLASDWSNIRGEVRRCEDANATQLHVDVFDGVYIDSPHALTFGPHMVEAIRRSTSTDKATTLDVHICVERPGRYVDALASAGADRFIFQWEAMADSGGGASAAIELARRVVDAGMRCGVSINPETRPVEIHPLLETGLVDVVDILAVEPGFGGQKFQKGALDKLRQLKKWRQEQGELSCGSAASKLLLMVDGGINATTGVMAIEAGADILVAGTFLFQHPGGLVSGLHQLRQASLLEATT